MGKGNNNVKVLYITTLHPESLIHEIKALDVLYVVCLLCISDGTNNNCVCFVNIRIYSLAFCSVHYTHILIPSSLSL